MKLLVTQEKLKKSRLKFIKAEIELGFTFATIARGTHDPDRFERNKRNALRAYNEATRFLRGTSLSVEELERIEFEIDKLRSALASFEDHPQSARGIS